ncbi:DUF4003 domain-containing protein [Metabacillus sp. GX 13764]|uniref:DUF4003 family protein n=1 Tax=Metabacillus kandeliae TaxID=2900151 RepID=UPI001E5ECA8D|nr:DUF4003 family protein [Metabacillus kandeliae]MCD7033577.1 DUF4003 domain-containing protein [Metabacillus kandeliae]
MNTASSLKVFRSHFETLKNGVKWKGLDQRSAMMIASMYTVNDSPLSLDSFLSLSENIRKDSGLFSPLRTASRFTIASALDVHHEDPSSAFQKLQKVYGLLVEKGFSKGIYTYIAGTVLLKEDFTDEVCEKASHLYKGMKKNHYFLTNQSDYPLAVLMALQKEPINDILESMENLYSALSGKSFKKGNELQFLSHILTLSSEGEILLDRCERIHKALSEQGIKPKPAFYPGIGLLALIDNSTEFVPSVKETYDALNSDKYFKWYQDMNRLLSVQLAAGKQIGKEKLAEAGFSAAVEAILQAQQAAMIAAVSSSIAASSSADGSSS